MGGDTATKLKIRREACGKTQVEIATAANITAISYYRYEAGDRLPRVDVARKIAAALHCTVEDIFD